MIVVCIIAAVFGFEFGSFANVCAYRWPRGGSVSYPRRSQCPWCSSQIKWFDNIPVISFLFLKGKCRACQSPISHQYPLVEFMMGLGFGLITLLYLKKFFAIDLFLFAALFFFFCCVVLTITDLDWKIIPNEISYALMGIGFAISPFNPFLDAYGMGGKIFMSFLGLALGWGLFSLLGFLGKMIFGKDSLGGGDIKLMGGVGAFFGPYGVFNSFVFSGLLGGAAVFLGLFLGVIKRRQSVPFGPFIALGAMVHFLLYLIDPRLLPEALLSLPR